MVERRCKLCQNDKEKTYYLRYNNELVAVCANCAPELERAEQRRRAEKVFERIVPKLFHSATLEKLPPALEKKIRTLPDDTGLFLWGPQGVGKSYAMAAIIRELLLAGHSVMRFSYEMLCLMLRDTYKTGSTKTELDVIEPLIAVDNLFIEDVGVIVSGAEQESNFSLRTFLVILDQRLEQCRATFITTNKSVEQVAESFDKRIASRLQEACEVIHLTGQDRRAKKVEANR